MQSISPEPLQPRIQKIQGVMKVVMWQDRYKVALQSVVAAASQVKKRVALRLPQVSKVSLLSVVT